jgi:hypothetical protein
LLAVPRPAAADEPRALRNTGSWFLAGELGTSAVLLGASLIIGDEPATCRWCQPSSLDRSVREALVADPDQRRSTGAWSHVISIGGAGAVAFSSAIVPAVMAKRERYAIEDSAIILSSFALVTGIGYATKKSVGRRRPAFYFGEQHHTEFGNNPEEQNLSFFSVDTAWAFVLGSSAATLSFLRGYPEAPYVTAAGAVFGVGTAWLRVASDVHWATDVMTGALVGTGVGVALPLVLHRRAEAGSDTGVVAAPLMDPARSAYAITLSGTF